MSGEWEARWRDLDDCIRGFWHADLHRAGEEEIRNDPDRTLLFLPHPYSSAAGSEAAFPEMYCWDPFFINLGLHAHGRLDIVRDHVRNQLFQVERYGFVPNGNRTFYLTRSQVPLLGESVRRYIEASHDLETAALALPLLAREYHRYWCSPPHRTEQGLATCVDAGDPRRRPELAAEAEAGLDFTAIFGGDIRRCVPIHVNCALVRYARAAASIATALGREDEARGWASEADTRAERLRALCWDEREGFFLDMNISNKPLVATIAALILAIGAAIGAKLWLVPNPEARVTASLNPACDLHAGPCASEIPGGGRIELSIEPRPIPLLRPLRLVVKAQGLDARLVEVDFTGVDMNMGYNRPQLKQEGEQFTGETVLPVCITGRMSWQAAVLVTTPGQKAIAPFRFSTSRN